MRYKIMEWVSIRAGFSLAYEFPHFMYTFADAGEDKNGDKVVQLEIPTIRLASPMSTARCMPRPWTLSGSNFRTGGMMTYQVMFGIEGSF